MKRIFGLGFILVWILTACSSPAATASTSTGAPAAIGEPAILTQVGTGALVRASAGAEYARPVGGETLPAGAEIITTEPDGARVAFPDGSILYLRPNTAVVITEINGKDSKPSVRVSLLAGEVLAITDGGFIQVDSAAGTAEVTGSMMGVTFDSLAALMELFCLEGHCTLRTDWGLTPLTPGQAAAALLFLQQTRAITQDHVNAFLQTLLTGMGPGIPEATRVASLTPAIATPQSATRTPKDNWSIDSAGSFTYTFENNCLGGGGKLARTTWHWIFRFSMGGYHPDLWFGVNIPPDTIRTGTLPAGTYTVIHDWTDEGTINNSLQPGEEKIYIPNDSIYVCLCPDDPPLPGSPRLLGTQSPN